MVTVLPAAVALSGLPEDELREIILRNENSFYQNKNIFLDLLKSKNVSPSSSNSSIGSLDGVKCRSRRNVNKNFYLDIVNTLEETFLNVQDDNKELVGKSRERLNYYCEIIDKLEEKYDGLKKRPSTLKLKYADAKIEVKYQQRDLLNLFDNIKEENLVKTAEIKLTNNVENFFQFRSIFSRLADARMPRHIMTKCNNNDCSFQEPKFY